jgi:hypothetical protein
MTHMSRLQVQVMMNTTSITTMIQFNYNFKIKLNAIYYAE